LHGLLGVVLALTFKSFTDLTEGALLVKKALIHEQSNSAGCALVFLRICGGLAGGLSPRAKNRMLQPFQARDNLPQTFIIRFHEVLPGIEPPFILFNPAQIPALNEPQ
jgi:hypothetical protein